MKSSRPKIKLGSHARDKITGFAGIVVAETTWLNGCRRVSIQPQELKDGKPIDAICFDIEQIEIVKPGSGPTKETGGPMPSPSRQTAPVR